MMRGAAIAESIAAGNLVWFNNECANASFVPIAAVIRNWRQGLMQNNRSRRRTDGPAIMAAPRHHDGEGSARRLRQFDYFAPSP
jgi:hypothetical protein